MLYRDRETLNMPMTVKSISYTFGKMYINTSRILSSERLREELDRVPGFGNTMQLSIRDNCFNDTVKDMVLDLTGWILRDKHEHESVTRVMEVAVPRTWWDMLVRDHFPKWWRDRWPPEMRTVSKLFVYEQQIRVCPHANVAWPDERHLHFLTFTETPLEELPGYMRGWTGPAEDKPQEYEG